MGTISGDVKSTYAPDSEHLEITSWYLLIPSFFSFLICHDGVDQMSCKAPRGLDF